MVGLGLRESRVNVVGLLRASVRSVAFPTASYCHEVNATNGSREERRSPWPLNRLVVRWLLASTGAAIQIGGTEFED